MAVKTPHQKKSLVIAQEIKFARILAGNNKNARAKKLKKLRTWLTLRSRSTIGMYTIKLNNYYIFNKYLIDEL